MTRNRKASGTTTADRVDDGMKPDESAHEDSTAEETASLKPTGNPVADTPRSAVTGTGRLADLIQFVKFGLVGVLNTLVDVLVYTLLIWIGAHYLLAQPLSYGAGMVNSYLVNKCWTFQDRRSGVGQFVRFALLNGGTLLLSLGLLYVFADGLGFDPLLSKGVVTLFTVVANFAGSRWWVFRQT